MGRATLVCNSVKRTIGLTDNLSSPGEQNVGNDIVIVGDTTSLLKPENNLRPAIFPLGKDPANPNHVRVEDIVLPDLHCVGKDGRIFSNLSGSKAPWVGVNPHDTVRVKAIASAPLRTYGGRSYRPFFGIGLDNQLYIRLTINDNWTLVQGLDNKFEGGTSITFNMMDVSDYGMQLFGLIVGLDNKLRFLSINDIQIVSGGVQVHNINSRTYYPPEGVDVGPDKIVGITFWDVQVNNVPGGPPLSYALLRGRQNSTTYLEGTGTNTTIRKDLGIIHAANVLGMTCLPGLAQTSFPLVYITNSNLYRAGFVNSSVTDGGETGWSNRDFLSITAQL